MTPLTIIDALTDPALLGAFIRRESWAAWFTLFRAFFALPPEPGDLALYQKATGRAEWPAEPSKELYVIAGRRSGKSLNAALLGAFLGAFVDYPNLAVGERAMIPIISPVLIQSKIILGYLSGIFNESEMLRGMVERETAWEIELRNSVTLCPMTSSFKSVRGWTCPVVILDEAAFFNAEGARSDIEVVRALRPTLATTGGPLIVISSPHSRSGILWTAFKNYFGKAGPVLVWRAPTSTMNPCIDGAVIERAMIEDEAAAQSEWCAEFRSDLESFIGREVIEALVSPGRFELPPVAGVQYRAFCDPSGGGLDSFTLAVSHLEGDCRVLDCIRERRGPGLNPENVVEEYAALLKSYGLHEVTGDKYAGAWVSSAFAKHGISYRASERTKSEIYLECLPVFNAGRVELLDLDRLTAQLCGLERRANRSGKDSVDHAPGGHDDLANAACGALLLCQAPAGISDLWAGPEIQTSEQYPLLGDRALWTNLD